MDHGLFRGWLAQVDDLTVAQRLELEEVLAGRPPRAAVTAAIEAGADDQRCCPHCGHRVAQNRTSTEQQLIPDEHCLMSNE